jgi:23S rRNA pseudouridine1911/1915/1917 synthase
MSDEPKLFRATADDAGKRLDQFLVAQLPDISRARVQQLIAQQKVLISGVASKSSLRLRGTEEIAVVGSLQQPPLRATPEDIPIEIVYEDSDLAVVNKPAGMMVHAGAGPSEQQRNRGTLVNALLHRFNTLSATGGELRPGIVHRLDKQTSGLMIVAKNDVAHRRLGGQFSGREVKKTYIALVHGWPKQVKGTVDATISRDRVRRTRMTTRRSVGRSAVSHYRVIKKIESVYGRFALLEVGIETGRTHQIRVHLASLGHPVVGDTLYGAPREIRTPQPKRPPKSLPKNPPKSGKPRAPAQSADAKPLSLARNFLHAAAIEFKHPSTSAPLVFTRPLPLELEDFLTLLQPGEKRTAVI